MHQASVDANAAKSASRSHLSVTLFGEARSEFCHCIRSDSHLGQREDEVVRSHGGLGNKKKQMKMCFVQENPGEENAEFTFYQIRIYFVIKSIWCACCAAPPLSPRGGWLVFIARCTYCCGVTVQSLGVRP